MTGLYEQPQKLFSFETGRPCCRKADNEVLVFKSPNGISSLCFVGFEVQRLSAGGVSQFGNQREPYFEVVANFSHGANRGARIADGVFLFNGNGWAYVFDRVHFGSLASFQKLPDVRAEGFDVFSLPLGVEHVEEQGRLACTAQAGKNHQLPWRKLEVHALEVIVTRSAKKYVWWVLALHAPGLATIVTMASKLLEKWRPVGDSNPCCRDENPVSWTWLDERDNKGQSC